MAEFTRRSFLKGSAAVAGAAIAGGALAACSGSNGSSDSGSTAAASAGSSADSGDKTKLTIGYWGGNCCELPVYVATENHYWEQAGIDPNMVTITADVTELLANDEIDCFQTTPGNFMSVLEGADLKIVDTVHTGCWSGITLEGNGIDNCKDLTGKKVGCSGMTGPSYVESNALCARQGGDPSKIDWVVYDGSLLLQALKDGEVDAIIGIDSTLYPQVRDTKKAKFFFISAQELANYYCCFIGVNSKTLEKDPSVGDKLVKAFALADDKIREDVDAAVEMAIEKGYTVGKYPGIEKGLAGNYLYGHGNEDDFHKSIKERYQELYDCGFLKDYAPKNKDEVDAYLEKISNDFGVWHGGAATENAAKPLADQAKERGDAFGVKAADIRNA